MPGDATTARPSTILAASTATDGRRPPFTGHTHHVLAGAAAPGERAVSTPNDFSGKALDMVDQGPAPVE